MVNLIFTPSLPSDSIWTTDLDWLAPNNDRFVVQSFFTSSSNNPLLPEVSADLKHEQPSPRTSAIFLCNKNKTHLIMLLFYGMLSMISLFCNICNVSAILLTVLSRPQNGHMRTKQRAADILQCLLSPLFYPPASSGNRFKIFSNSQYIFRPPS